MDMKKLLESMDECGMNEMPGMPAVSPQEVDKGNPVTVNVSMNASGKEHVADLLDMMKNAGLGGAEAVSAKTLSPRMDMERLAGIMDDPEIPGKDDVPGDSDTTDSSCNDDLDMDEDGYANAPDTRVGDMQDVTPDGDDLHRSKDRKAIRTNDPALENIKADLYAALSEKKAKPDFLDMDKDGDKKEPMKKAIKDKAKKVDEGADEGKMPSKSVVEKHCNEGMSTAEICKKYPDCDQEKLKELCKTCQEEMKEAYEDKKGCPKCKGKTLLKACSSCGCS